MASSLRVGDIVKLGEAEYRVDMVNECRARCTALAGRRVTIQAADGATRTFTAPGQAIDISPWSVVDIVGHDKAWERKQRAAARRAKRRA
jgi:hypothetical protein